MADNNRSATSIDSLPVRNFEELLWQSFGNGLKIQHVRWKRLTESGENFGSLIFAIDVDVVQSGSARTEALHLVAKLPPRSEYLLDLFNSPLTFKKELCFYNTIVPVFMELQLESGFRQEDLSILVPKFFGGRMGLKHSDEFDDQAAIVLENLNYGGYDVQDRIIGLDKPHVEFAVKELAKLHALMICLREKKPDFFDKVVMPFMIEPENEAAEKGVRGMTDKAANDVRTIKEAKPYFERMDKTLEHSIRYDGEKPEEPWATVLHRDFWVNNMMFQHDKAGHVTNMKIVDFQLCVYDYGVKDLIFFLISSSRKDVLDNDLDEMIDLYYNRFVQYLKLLKVDVNQFPRDKYIELVNYCGPLQFEHCLQMAQVIQNRRGTTPNMEEIKDEGVFSSIEGNDEYKGKLLQILHVYDRKGWLLR